MENPQPQPTQSTDQQMLAEILENSRKTKNYIKWQLIITVALVVIPLLVTIAVIPFALNSVSSALSGGLLESGTTIDTSNIQDLIKQYQQ